MGTKVQSGSGCQDRTLLRGKSISRGSESAPGLPILDPIGRKDGGRVVYKSGSVGKSSRIAYCYRRLEGDDSKIVSVEECGGAILI